VTSTPGPRVFDLVIDSLAYQGSGVGRHEGAVVFVPFTAPGDRVRVRVVSERRRYAHAEVLDVLAPSPARVEPACPHFGVCGGCQWQHVAYERQLEAKRKIVADALRRIAGVDAPVEAVVPSPSPYRYRNRARFHIDAAGRVGFYRRASHALVEVRACPVLDERLEAALAGLRGTPGPAETELRVAGDGSVVEAAGLPFGQVNGEVNDRLKACLGGQAALAFGPGGPRSILDRYCGEGNLSLPLAAGGTRVLGCDVSAAAVAAAAARARALGAAAEYRVEAISPRTLARLGRETWDLVILDPPRTGLPGLARAAAALGAPLVALVSCAPPMLARDLRAFLAEGYAVSLVQPFDMFPQTFHVETLAMLRLAGAGPAPGAGFTHEGSAR
jgi:23S rRNA (uracil1939-C5)-methyltransferase